jgi:hypothetical protein
MVVVAIDSKCSFEDRALSVLLNQNPSPANVGPFSPRMMLQPSISLENSIF